MAAHMRPAAVAAVAGSFLLLASACSDDAARPADAVTPPVTEAAVAPTTEAETPPTTEAVAPPTTEAETPPTTEEAVPPTVSARAELAERNVLGALVTVDSDQPVQVRLVARSGDHEVVTPYTAASATNHRLPLVGMRAERTYTIEVEAVTAAGSMVTGAVNDVTTGALPVAIPEFEVDSDPGRMAPGYTIIETFPMIFPIPEGVGPVNFAVDDEGEVVWYYRYTAAVAGLSPTSDGTFIGHSYPTGLTEFDILGGTVRRWQIASAAEVADDPEAADQLFDAQLLGRLPAGVAGLPGDPPAIPVEADWVELRSMHHENHLMPNGNILFLSTTLHGLTDEQRAAFCPGDDLPFDVISDVVVEMEPDGTVVRTWDLWDAIDIDETPGSWLCDSSGIYAESLERDWTHANAVIYDPNRDAVIVSVRHTDQIVALDHLDDLGPQSDVRWIIGTDGTVPIDGEQTYHQHAVELQDDGSILVYDNGNDRPGTVYGDPASPMYSRAVQIQVDDSSPDPVDWTATEVWQHTVDDIDGILLYAYFVGDANRLANGSVLIDHGGIGDGTDYQRARIIEVVPDAIDGGDIVFDLSMGTPEFGAASYRAHRVPTFYTGPLWES